MIAPSRKIIAISIICVALVGSVAYVKINPQEESVSNGFLTTIELPEIAVPIYASEDKSDTDNDGLKDWQEVIQGTNANDPDSDGDGTQDGAEIEAGRNPLKKGPDDKGPSTAELTVGSNEVYSAYVPQSLTDRISKDLFSTYIQAKSDGLTGDSQNLLDIANSIAQEALAKNEMVNKYSTDAIGVFADSDSDAATAYGEQFGAFYIQMLEALDRIPAEDMISMAEQYQIFSKNLTSLYVPQSLAATQANIGNNFYNLALMFSIIAKYDQDPIRATLAIRNMKELLAKQSTLFTAVGNYFRRNGILFENQDIQRLWANI